MVKQVSFIMLRIPLKIECEKVCIIATIYIYIHNLVWHNTQYTLAPAPPFRFLGTEEGIQRVAHICYYLMPL